MAIVVGEAVRRKLGKRADVVVVCNECGEEKTIKFGSYNRAMKSRGRYVCLGCVNLINWKNPNYRAKALSGVNNVSKELRSYRSRKMWNNPGNKKKISESIKRRWEDSEYRSLRSEQSQEHWRDDEYRKKITGRATANHVTKFSVMPEFEKPRSITRNEFSNIIRKSWNKPGHREFMSKMMSERIKELWSRPEYREKLSATMSTKTHRELKRKIAEKTWQEPNFREKMAIARSNQPRISSQQEMLYKVLSDLGLEFFEEGPNTRIGFYVFDCLIPKQKGLAKDILIEVQGDYWHSLPETKRSDKGKFTYIDRYFPDYEIMYIWEREFYSHNRVRNRIKQKLGISAVESVDYSFEDVIIEKCDRKSNKEFLDLYHYLGPNRGGTVYGAYLGQDLIAVCQFSPPVRKEVATAHNLKYENVLELSRFCIHPSYQKRNFASWFISRAVQKISGNKLLKLLVAFSDTIMGHHGTIYRASNWTLDGETKPDYWYEDKDGYVMHKKTLWDRASRMKMKEREFAERYKYKKIWGGKKLRFIKEVG